MTGSVSIDHGLRIITSRDDVPAGTATLFLRLGTADETLARRGWAHLFEHWALTPMLEHANGSTSPCLMTFQLTHEPELLPDAISTLLRRIGDPDLAGIDHDVHILSHETRGRTDSWNTRLLQARFGVEGVGATTTSEYGTKNVDPQQMRAWLAPYTVNQNAVLVLDGYLAAPLSAALPEGQWQPMPTGWEMPTPAAGRMAGGIFLSGHLPAGRVGLLAADILSRHLYRRLRSLLLTLPVQHTMMVQLSPSEDLLALAWPPDHAAVLPLDELVAFIDALARGEWDASLVATVRELDRVDRGFDPTYIGLARTRAALLLQTGRDQPDSDAEQIPDTALVAAIAGFRQTMLLAADEAVDLPAALIEAETTAPAVASTPSQPAADVDVLSWQRTHHYPSPETLSLSGATVMHRATPDAPH